MKRKILGAALGSCVHVAGLSHFLDLAAAEGYEVRSLGPAVPVSDLVKAIRDEEPDLVAVSYRLTPSAAGKLLEELKNALEEAGLKSQRLVFGGTPPVAEVAGASGLFERTFSGLEPRHVVRAYLRGVSAETGGRSRAEDLLTRIESTYPYPLLRHHFGLPTVEATVRGAAAIAEAEVLDVISLGPDQNAQEHFFHPEEMDPAQDGAGGVPLRRPEDMEAIFEASRRGNHPLIRCYSGTRDLLRWAEMSVRTVRNAWAAIPLGWYSALDGRSSLSVLEAIREHQSVIRWYADRGIPVEVNEAHQWSLREAPDALAVAMAFLAAYNAKRQGVRDFVAQYMFNTPPGTTARMDLAKMLAKKEMIESLEDAGFRTFRQVRAGIAHFSPDPSVAKGQLAASAALSLALKPHILHVVGFSEGDHAALPEEVIESCRIVHGVLDDCLGGFPDFERDPVVRARKDKLKREAGILLDALAERGPEAAKDPWADAETLDWAIRTRLLDAPHIAMPRETPAKTGTRLIDGGWEATDLETGKILGERERIRRVLGSAPAGGNARRSRRRGDRKKGV